MVQEFETIPRKWGNSLGITFPKEIVKRGGLNTKKRVKILILDDESSNLEQIFGTFKFKKPTQKLLDEVDKELYGI